MQDQLPDDDDQEGWVKAVSKDGLLLARAPREWRYEGEPNDVVLAAVKQDSMALKFLGSEMRQNETVAMMAGIRPAVKNAVKKQAICVSKKFSFGDEDLEPDFAMAVWIAVRKDPYLSQFPIYNPDARTKKSCDPMFTNFAHPCRGTLDTCQLGNSGNTSNGHPTPVSCWRYSFRWYEQESHDTGGFVLQIISLQRDGKPRLGDGQVIEEDMAKLIGVKIIKITQESWSENAEGVHQHSIAKLSAEARAWMEPGVGPGEVELREGGQEEELRKREEALRVKEAELERQRREEALRVREAERDQQAKQFQQQQEKQCCTLL